MGHYVIYYHWVTDAYKRIPRAVDYAERLIIRMEKVCRFDYYTRNPTEVAEKLSRCRAIENVHIIHVSEQHVGVWRNGVKS